MYGCEWLSLCGLRPRLRRSSDVFLDAQRPAGIKSAPGEIPYGVGNLPISSHLTGNNAEERNMDGIVYLVGLIVIIMFVLSLFGLR
jgi:hypothetical protein